jgi:hypothetical protein
MMVRILAHQWWQQRHCNDGNNASLRMAITPSQWGHNTTANQGQQHHCYEGNNAILMTARTPVHQTTVMMPFSWGKQLQSQQQQRHLRIDGNNAIAMRAMMPTWQKLTRVEMLAQQWRRCLHINDGNNAITTRATITIATTAKMLAHQWQ